MPLGSAEIVEEGSELTIITYGTLVHVAQAAARLVGARAIRRVIAATYTGVYIDEVPLSVAPDEAWIDGNHCPQLAACRAQAITGGDRMYAQISAASIIAKTERDAEMRRLHARYPQYGLDRHKGYPTPEHLTLLERHGVSEIHRRTFAPVRRILV